MIDIPDDYDYTNVLMSSSANQELDVNKFFTHLSHDFK